MRVLRALWLRLGDRLLRRRRERELQSELDAHLAMHVDDNLRAGMTPGEARRHALIALGGVEVMKEQYRDRRSLPFLDTFLRDAAFGWRLIVRNPGFSTVAVAALGVGIGANVAVFSLANALLLRPLPAYEPDRIVRVATFNFSATPYGEYEVYRDNARTLESLMAFNGVSLGLRDGGDPEHIFGMAVTGNYFGGLGVSVARGRPIAPADDDAGAPGALVLGDRFWRRRFAADPDIVGRVVSVNGQSYTIVGIVSPKFAGTMAPFVPDVFVPWNGPGIGPARATEGSGFFSRPVHVLGRLRPDATILHAHADLNALAAGIAARSPDRPDLRVTVYPGRTLHAEFSQAVTVFVTLLTTIVGLVLLVACVNIANLLLARSAARRREVGVRLALGAGRWRLVRQLVTESAIVAALGSFVGCVLAWALTRVVSALELPMPIPVELDLSFDWRTLVFAVGMMGLTTMLFGLVPALQASKVAVTASLKDGSPGAGRGRSRLRSALVTSQVALSTLLLVIGAVLARGLTTAHAIDRGFSGSHVLTASVDLGAGGYTADRGRVFLEDLLQRLGDTPGVAASNLAFIVPLTLSNSQTRFYAEGDDDGIARGRPLVYFNQVTRGHFRTLGIPLLAGRDFTPADRPGSPAVAIVNQTLAELFWPGESPLGKRLQMRNVRGEGGEWIEVVGLAKNSKYVTIGEDPAPFLYRPLPQDYQSAVTLLVRTTGDPTAILPGVRAAVRSIDPELPLFNISPLDAVTAVSLLPVQIAASLAGALGVVALVLAAIGLYGVMSYLVRQRTSEIGTRIALGATPSDVIRVITRQGMRWTVVGLAIGLAAAALLTRLLTSLLYGVNATDFTAFAGITLVLGLTAYAACYVPARRASRLDPLIALRYE
jgi:putative ABC transport system permease protein